DRQTKTASPRARRQLREIRSKRGNPRPRCVGHRGKRGRRVDRAVTLGYPPAAMRASKISNTGRFVPVPKNFFEADLTREVVPKRYHLEVGSAVRTVVTRSTDQ